MPRKAGTYRTTKVHGEEVRAFIPKPLPPRNPVLKIEGTLAERHAQAAAAIARLQVACTMVPDIGWFLYGFVRKEAVLSSQIEGMQATLEDVARFEATATSDRPADVEEVCNYVDALNDARAQIHKPKGLPLSVRLLCKVHGILMRGTRGKEKQPGQIRRSQNWIGGSRPGNAHFVPPPPAQVPDAMAALEQWIHSDDRLPPLVRAGLAHVQFETIHPFLDGNGRIGRLLITLLVEHWGLLDQPLLYLSVAFKRRQQEYYARLDAVRSNGDWEGWTEFFLDCVHEAAEDAVEVAGRLFHIVSADRRTLLAAESVTVTAVRLLEQLPEHPVMTLARAVKLLDVAKPTAAKCLDDLVAAGILHETTGRQRDRMYVYRDYLAALTGDDDREDAHESSRQDRFDRALETVHERFGRTMHRLSD